MKNFEKELDKVIVKTTSMEGIVFMGNLPKETKEQLLTLFSKTLDDVIKVRVGENLGMGRLDSHQKTAIKGVLSYIRARKKELGL